MNSLLITVQADARTGEIPAQQLAQQLQPRLPSLVNNVLEVTAVAARINQQPPSLNTTPGTLGNFAPAMQVTVILSERLTGNVADEVLTTLSEAIWFFGINLATALPDQWAVDMLLGSPGNLSRTGRWFSGDGSVLGSW